MKLIGFTTHHQECVSFLLFVKFWFNCKKKRKKKKEAIPAPVEVIQITEVIPYVTDS